LHDVEIMIGLHLEDRQHLVQHRTVLACHAGFDTEVLHFTPEVQQDRAQFDGFRPCPEDK